MSKPIFLSFNLSYLKNTKYVLLPNSKCIDSTIYSKKYKDILLNILSFFLNNEDFCINDFVSNYEDKDGFLILNKSELMIKDTDEIIVNKNVKLLDFIKLENYFNTNLKFKFSAEDLLNIKVFFKLRINTNIKNSFETNFDLNFFNDDETNYHIYLQNLFEGEDSKKISLISIEIIDFLSLINCPFKKLVDERWQQNKDFKYPDEKQTIYVIALLNFQCFKKCNNNTIEPQKNDEKKKLIYDYNNSNISFYDHGNTTKFPSKFSSLGLSQEDIFYDFNTLDENIYNVTSFNYTLNKNKTKNYFVLSDKSSGTKLYFDDFSLNDSTKDEINLNDYLTLDKIKSNMVKENFDILKNPSKWNIFFQTFIVKNSSLDYRNNLFKSVNIKYQVERAHDIMRRNLRLINDPEYDDFLNNEDDEYFIVKNKKTNVIDDSKDVIDDYIQPPNKKKKINNSIDLLEKTKNINNEINQQKNMDVKLFEKLQLKRLNSGPFIALLGLQIKHLQRSTMTYKMECNSIFYICPFELED